MKSKSIQTANAQGITELCKSDRLNNLELTKIANIPKIHDQVTLVYFFLVASDEKIEVLTRQKVFWKRIKRLMMLPHPKWESDLALMVLKQCDIEIDFEPFLIEFLVRICKIEIRSLLKRCQIMLIKCDVVQYCISRLCKYPQQILHLLEYLTLECMENQVVFANDLAVLETIVSFIPTYYSCALKALINISSGNAAAVKIICDIIDLDILLSSLDNFDNNTNFTLSLGLVLNILEFQPIVKLGLRLDSIITLYHIIEEEEDHKDKTSTFLIEILMLWCCKYELMAISKVQKHIKVDNTLKGMYALVQMGSNRWSGMKNLVTYIENLL